MVMIKGVRKYGLYVLESVVIVECLVDKLFYPKHTYDAKY